MSTHARQRPLPARGSGGVSGRVLVDALQTLGAEFGNVETLELLPDAGLAHTHIRLVGSGLLARIPKQSQMGLAAGKNLHYQAECYRRAARSGHVPRLERVMAPSPGLPRGALIVEEIVGTCADEPEHIEAIVTALARIHALAVPPNRQRAPLLNEPDPAGGLLEIIREQARFLEHADIDATSRRIVGARIEAIERSVAGLPRPPSRLIAFDTHPGNFLLTASGKAILVDLEKARYSYPPLDLAHATLYTSTTWVAEAGFVLNGAEVLAAYRCWHTLLGDAAAPYLPWMIPLRIMMWLWSITWCAKWLALAPAGKKDGNHGEDWSAANSDAELVRHVRERVEHYLAPATVERVVGEFTDLRAAAW